MFQPNAHNKLQVISYNSRILSTQKQKLSTYDRGLCAIVFALSQYEFMEIGSKFPIAIFTDHNSILFFDRKGNLTPRLYKTQMLLGKFFSLQFIQTAGTNLTVVDMLSNEFSNINKKHVNCNIKPFLHILIFFNLKMI